GRGLQERVTKAREDGHEVLLAIPLEPNDYPAKDPGPHTLLTTLPPKDNIKRVSRFQAGHAFVTEDVGKSCELTAKPFVVDCDYDQAGELLAHIYGQLNPPAQQPVGSNGATSDPDQLKSGVLHKNPRYIVFDQRSFTQGKRSHGFADDGIAYIPDACREAAGCRVHIAFHGCGQSRDQVGDAFVHGSGFARWADTNRLIILFPQVKAGPGNAQACWDWWGYTGDNFLTREAAQISTVNHMLQHLAGARGTAPGVGEEQ
nr:divergent polysaccharide deacetylase family protein [Alphaproteobacteria bacterium]